MWGLSHLHKECVLEESQIGIIIVELAVPPEEEGIVLGNYPECMVTT